MELETRNRWICHASGLIFAIGWWIFLDGVVYAVTSLPVSSRVQFTFWLPILFSTLGLFLLNSIPYPVLSSSSDDAFREPTPPVARLLMFFALACGFMGLIGSILIHVLVYDPLQGNAAPIPAEVVEAVAEAAEAMGEAATEVVFTTTQVQYPGLTLIISSLCVLFSMLLFKFGREPLDEF